MYLIEIFLPLADNNGKPFADAKFAAVRETLAARFGGMTAFARAPAEGVFREGPRAVRDDIVVIEVMVEALERETWKRYRAHLQREFAQDEILLRATAIERL
jgi:hypothetical protein